MCKKKSTEEAFRKSKKSAASAIIPAVVYTPSKEVEAEPMEKAVPGRACRSQS
jgi:hypothetical protein